MAIAMAVMLGCGIPGARSEEARSPMPDGIVKVSASVLAAGVGYRWGRGTLYFQGQSLDFCVRGLSIGDVGAARMTIDGAVYNLDSPDDFFGNYSAMSVGAAVGGGETWAFLSNKRGVTMELDVKERGVRLNFAATGLRVVMAGNRGCKARSP